MLLRPVFRDLEERFTADIVDAVLKMAVAFEAALKRVVRPGKLVAIGHQPAFDPFDQVRASGADIQRAACLPHKVPECAAKVPALEVDLEAALLAVAGTGDHLARAQHVECAKAEIGKRRDLISEQLCHQGFRFRSLHG